MIEKYNIKDKVELILEKDQFIIKPISTPRKDWEIAFKVIALKTAIQEGIDSGIAQDFEPKKHLETLKAKKNSNGWVQADKFFDSLISNCQEIADNPDLGKYYEGISKQL